MHDMYNPSITLRTYCTCDNYSYQQNIVIYIYIYSISYNTAVSALPDIYARCLRASAYISGKARVPVL